MQPSVLLLDFAYLATIKYSTFKFNFPQFPLLHWLKQPGEDFKLKKTVTKKKVNKEYFT